MLTTKTLKSKGGRCPFLALDGPLKQVRTGAFKHVVTSLDLYRLKACDAHGIRELLTGEIADRDVSLTRTSAGDKGCLRLGGTESGIPQRAPDAAFNAHHEDPTWFEKLQ